ncbi:O-antigen ligase family protein [Cerasicoccus frondis]|uniref:O-antigen ligase family protein n=1 Tax=Cerasicoccus frondis TaxID=490090 RepID=UPI002852C9AF|nr:O-antigen ligase family protein [Cerasicoccus frondis]
MKHHKVAVFGELTLANCLDWVVTLCVCGWLFLLAYQLGGARPDTMIISTGFVGVALALHTLGLVAGSIREAVKINPLGFVFFPALIYMALNLYLLSPFVWRGREELMTMVQGVAVFWLAVQSFRTKNHVWFLLSVLIALATLGVAIAIMQFFHKPTWLPGVIDPIEGASYRVRLPEQYHGRASGFFGAPTAFAGFMLIIGFPVLAAGFCRRFTGMARAFFIYAGLISLGAVFLSMSRGALLLVIIGIFLLPLVIHAKVRSIITSWLLLGVLFSGAFGLLYVFNDEFQERITTAIEVGGESSRPVMWQAAWQQFLDAPILGNGMGGYDVLFENQRPEGFNRTPKHAHNDYLEMLADQGVVGFFLFWAPVGLILFLAFREWRNQPDAVKVSGSNDRKHTLRMPTPKFLISILGLGVLLFLGHSLMEFHLKTPALMMLFFLYLGLLCKCAPVERWTLPRTAPWQFGVLFVGLGLALLIPLWSLPVFKGYYFAQNGRRMLDGFANDIAAHKQDQAYFSEMIFLLHEGVRLTPDHADAWSDLSNAVASQEFLYPGQGEAFGQEAEGYARTAIQICPRLPQAWINLGNTLTLQSRLVEAGDAYQKATEVAPNYSDVWYYYALHLNLLNSTRPQALEAVERAIALEPGNEDAIDLRRKILVP